MRAIIVKRSQCLRSAGSIESSFGCTGATISLPISTPVMARRKFRCGSIPSVFARPLAAANSCHGDRVGGITPRGANGRLALGPSRAGYGPNRRFAMTVDRQPAEWPEKPPRIVAVRPLDGYRVELKFSEGTQGVVDLEGWLIGAGGVFAPWRMWRSSGRCTSARKGEPSSGPTVLISAPTCYSAVPAGSQYLLPNASSRRRPSREQTCPQGNRLMERRTITVKVLDDTFAQRAPLAR